MKRNYILKIILWIAILIINLLIILSIFYYGAKIREIDNKLNEMSARL